MAPKNENQNMKKRKINFDRIITVGNFELANPEITCSTFVYSSLSLPWSVTLAEIPRACAK